jgi:hypothetical protein
MEQSISTPTKISRVATVLILIALIRHISEIFRLNYYAENPLTFGIFRPYLLGSLVCAIALLFMTILSYWRQHKSVTVVAILAIISLLILKVKYL